MRGIMKKIDAIIRSSSLYSIQEELIKQGIPTFSVYQVQITGIHKAHEGWRNKSSDFIPKVKIEIICPDEQEDKIVDIIQKSANTGEKGDGIVFSYEINKLVKIRDGKMGVEAL